MSLLLDLTYQQKEEIFLINYVYILLYMFMKYHVFVS